MIVHGNPLITENPVKRLSQTRAWYRVERRQFYIKSHELTVWHQELMNAKKFEIITDETENDEPEQNLESIKDDKQIANNSSPKI